MDTPPEVLFQASVESLPLLYRGKVRDVFAVNEHFILIVATDRLSAFDVILPDPIPGKGKVLTAMSEFWFERSSGLVANHCADIRLEEVLEHGEERSQVNGRATIARRLEALPVEAIVRGYLIGSGWKDYEREGAICGIPLPAGLPLAAQLPAPLFTPSTKAASGSHDENISFPQTQELLGAELAEKMRDTSLRLYEDAARYARERGIIVADTKFEFGLDSAGELTLIDEVLTPDSSRFWPAEAYRVGSSPPSFDKQFVRDYLETLEWDKVAPGPKLPPDIIQQTAAKYREALQRLTGESGGA